MFMPHQAMFIIDGGEWVEFGPGLSGYLIRKGNDNTSIVNYWRHMDVSGRFSQHTVLLKEL